MTIKTRCPGCKKDYTLSDGLAGKRVRCKRCTETFLVRPPTPPPRDEVDEVDEAEEAPAPRARRRREDGFREEEPPRRRSNGFREEEPARPRGRRPVAVPEETAEEEDRDDYDQEDEDERPRRPKPLIRKRTPVWVWVTVGTVLAVLLLGGVAVFLIAGVGSSKVTQANFDKIKPGMPEQEVLKLLGKPTDELNNDLMTKVLTWRDGESYICVTISDGKVFIRQGYIKGS